MIGIPLVLPGVVVVEPPLQPREEELPSQPAEFISQSTASHSSSDGCQTVDSRAMSCKQDLSGPKTPELLAAELGGTTRTGECLIGAHNPIAPAAFALASACVPNRRHS